MGFGRAAMCVAAVPNGQVGRKPYKGAENPLRWSDVATRRGGGARGRLTGRAGRRGAHIVVSGGTAVIDLPTDR